MSGKDEQRLKDGAVRRIEQSINLLHMATATHSQAKELGPLVAEAFVPGVNKARYEVDLEIRTFALDYLGMVPRVQEGSNDN